MRRVGKYQARVLAALAWMQNADGTPEPIGYATYRVKATVDAFITPLLETTPVQVLEALRACVRYEWVKARTISPEGAGLGAALAWAIQPAGYEALQLAPSETDDQKENDMDATMTADPSTEEETEETVDDADLEVLDADGDAEHNPPVNEGSNQLSLAIGGPKPKSSILKILAKQAKYGSTRQFKNMERIEFHGVLEIREVAIGVEQQGHVSRTQKAVIAVLHIDGEEVELD